MILEISVSIYSYSIALIECVRLFFVLSMLSRNPNNPTLVGAVWPQYTADTEEYLGISLNMTVRSQMRPEKMAFWNEFVPSIEETIKPTTSSHIPMTTEQTDDKKGIST